MTSLACHYNKVTYDNHCKFHPLETFIGKQKKHDLSKLKKMAMEIYVSSWSTIDTTTTRVTRLNCSSKMAPRVAFANRAFSHTLFCLVWTEFPNVYCMYKWLDKSLTRNILTRYKFDFSPFSLIIFRLAGNHAPHAMAATVKRKLVNRP